MKRNTHKLIGILIAAALLLALLPATAFALADDFTMTPENPRVGDEVTCTGPDTVDGYPVTGWDWTVDSIPFTNSTQERSTTFNNPGEHEIICTAHYNGGSKPISHVFTVPKRQPALYLYSGDNPTYTYKANTDFTIVYGMLNATDDSTLDCKFRIPGLNIESGKSLPNISQETVSISSGMLFSAEAGAYPIYGEITGDSQNEDFSGQIGTLTIQKATPAVTPVNQNPFTYGAGDCSGAPAVTLAIEKYEGTEAIAPVLTCNGVEVNRSPDTPASALNVPQKLFSLAPDAMNTIPPGVYNILWETPETKHNNAASANVGEVTLTGVKSVAVAPAEAAVKRGGDQAFAVTVETVGSGINSGVDWSLTGAASPNTKTDPAGNGIKVRVGADETAETLTLTAASQHGNGTQGKVVGTAAIHIPQVRSVAVSPDAASVRKGGTLQLTADVTAVNGADKGVSWTVDGTGSSIDQNGLLTVGTGETAEQLIVTAASNYDGSAIGYADVTIDVSGGPAEIKDGQDGTWTFNGHLANLKALRLNGVAFGIEPQSATLANLTYPGYGGIAGIAEQGSVKVTLYKEFLATLPAGKYTLEAEFDNDGTLQTGALEFTLLREAQPSATPTATPTTEGTSPKTGDDTNLALWIGLALIAGAGIFGGMAHRRKERKS